MYQSILLAISLALYQVPWVQAQARPPTDVTHSGPYVIANCDSNAADSSAQKLAPILSETSFYIQQHIIPDIERIPSSPAFRTFLSGGEEPTPDHRELIANMFRRMARGSAFHVGHDPDTLHEPAFVCLQDTDVADPGHRRLYDMLCPSGLNTAYLHGSPVNYLCPKFFAARQWPSSEQCPTLLGKSTYAEPKSSNLTSSQFAFVVAGLASLYMVHDAIVRPEVAGDFVEILQVGRAVEASKEVQVRNAVSYAFYAAGEIVSSSRVVVKMLTAVFEAIRAGCTQFPDTAYLHDELRRLQWGPLGPSDDDAGTLKGPIGSLPDSVVAQEDYIHVNESASHYP